MASGWVARVPENGVFEMIRCLRREMADCLDMPRYVVMLDYDIRSLIVAAKADSVLAAMLDDLVDGDWSVLGLLADRMADSLEPRCQQTARRLQAFVLNHLNKEKKVFRVVS